MKKYERLFIIVGIIATSVLAITGLWFWLKHSLSIIITDIDDLFGSDEEGVEPEVVDASYADDENDEYGDICD